jgi:hypothetical protein
MSYFVRSHKWSNGARYICLSEIRMRGTVGILKTFSKLRPPEQNADRSPKGLPQRHRHQVDPLPDTMKDVSPRAQSKTSPIPRGWACAVAWSPPCGSSPRHFSSA